MNYFNMLIWALITDVIDDKEVRTHSRDDGTVYGFYSFARKVGQALAGGVSGFALSAIGYDSLCSSTNRRSTGRNLRDRNVISRNCLYPRRTGYDILISVIEKIVIQNTEELKRRREET